MGAILDEAPLLAIGLYGQSSGLCITAQRLLGVGHLARWNVPRRIACFGRGVLKGSREEQQSIESEALCKRLAHSVCVRRRNKGWAELCSIVRTRLIAVSICCLASVQSKPRVLVEG